jgi:hypothetical protein
VKQQVCLLLLLLLLLVSNPGLHRVLLCLVVQANCWLAAANQGVVGVGG